MHSILSILLACGDKSEDTVSQVEDTGSNSVEAPDFVGMDFLLESSDGHQVLAGYASLGFSEMDGEFVGFQFQASCNSFGGRFLLDDGVMTMEDLSMTEMGCEQSAMAEDDWFADFWMSSPSLNLDGSLLTVSQGEDTFYFRDREIVTPNLSLVDTLWLIDTFIDGDSASNYALNQDPSVEFISDGTVSVNTGCNDGGGTYTVDGSTISVSIDTYTDAICEDQSGQDAESHIMSVLAGEVEYSISIDRITLMNGTKGISAQVEQITQADAEQDLYI